MSAPYWLCACGDTAPVSSESLAMAGAAAHWLLLGTRLCTQVLAYGETGAMLGAVNSAAHAVRVRNRYRSPYRDGCVAAVGPSGIAEFCGCGCLGYQSARTSW